MIAQELTLAHGEWIDKLVQIANRPMPIPTTSLVVRSAFLASQAMLQQLVHKTLRPETLRRRPKIAERLAARSSTIPSRSRLSNDLGNRG
jgi:hypothetical protein